MKTPIINTSAKRPRLLAAVLLVATTLALPAAPLGKLYWDPLGTSSTNAGGAGTWDDSTANWWTGSAPYTWIPGTAGSVATYTDLYFGGTAGGAPYMISLALDSIQAPSISSTDLYYFTFNFSGNYIIQSTHAAGTILGITGGKYAYVTMLATPGSTVTFNSPVNRITITSDGNNSTNPSVRFAGGGTFDFMGNATISNTDKNGRVTVGNIADASITTLNLIGSSVEMSASRLWLDKAVVNVDGAVLNLDKNDTNSDAAGIRSALHIGGMAAAGGAPSIFNLNSGTVRAIGTTGTARGVMFGYAANSPGGTINLNGGVLAATSIQVSPSANANTTAVFVFNGGTLAALAEGITDSVAMYDNQYHLGGFISGFANTERSKVVIETGGAFIDTGAIGGRTATIASVISGSGNLTKLGTDTLRFSAASTYTGTTFVNGGTLTASVNNAFAASAALNIGAGGVFDAGATTQTIRNLSGAGTLANGTGQINAFNDTGETSTFAGTFALGTGGFAKTGAGTLVLTTDNTANTRAITVSAGRLLLGNTASAKLGGLVTVESGAIFGGLGTATGTVALNSGGILQSGTVAAGALSVNTLQLNAGSILGFNIDTGNASTSLNVTNPIAFLSGATAADITINLSALINGTYNLGNIISLENAVVKYDGMTLGGGRQIANLDVIGGSTLQLTLDVGTSLRVIWTGLTDGNWNLSGTNWKKASDSGAIPFILGDTVVFDDSLTTNRRDIMLAAAITVSDMIVSGTGNYSFSEYSITADAASVMGTALTGATGKLVMEGTGTLTLAPDGTNDFKGGIELQSGVLVAASSGALGSASITGSGTLAKTGTDTLAIATDKLATTIALKIYEGTLSLSKPTSGAYTFANQLTGNGTLAIKLTGTADVLSLGAGSTNGFAGILAIEDASFTLNTASAAQLAAATLGVGAGSLISKTAGDMTIGGLALDGGTLQLATDGLLPDGILTVGALNTGDAGTVTDVIMDLGADGGLTQFNPAVPPSTNILDHDNGSATGELVIAVTGAITGAGTLRLTGTDGNPAASSITSVIEQYVPGSTIIKENVADATYGIALVTGSDGVYLGSALTGISVRDGKQLILDNSAPGVDNVFTVGISGPGGLLVQASGTIILSGSNSYTGITTLATGVTRAARADIFKDSASVQIDSGATFETGGNAQTLRNLSGGGTVDLGGANLTLAAADASATEFSGALTGAGNITKIGSGTLTLSGISTRGTGTTSINDGRLIVKNNFSALGSGAVNFTSPTASLEFNNITTGTFDLAVTGGGIVAIRDSDFIFGNTANRLSEFHLINSTVLPTASIHALGSTTSHVYIDPTSALYVSYAHGTHTNPLRIANMTVAPGGRLLYGLNAAVTKIDLGGGVLTLEDGAVLGFAGRVPDGIYDLIEDGTGTVLRQGAIVLDKGPNKMVQWRATDNDDIELITLSYDPSIQVSMTFDAMMAAMSAIQNRVSANFLLPLVEAHRASKINGLWMSGFSSSANYKETDNQYGHSEDTLGMVVGFDALSKNRKYMMGVYGGFAGSTLDTDANARSDSDQQFAGLYGAAKWGKFYLGIDGMAGWSKSSITRHQSDGGISDGTSKVNYFGGGVEAGYVFQPFQAITLKPSAGLQYLNAEFGSYKERGDSAIAYPDIDRDLLQSCVSMQLSWKFSTPWGQPCVVDLGYAWRQNISEKSDDVTVRFVSDTTQAPYTIRAGNYVRGSRVVSGGLRCIVNSSLSFGIGYEFEVASHRSRHTAHGTVRYAW